MPFACDLDRRAADKRKKGKDFEATQALWEDPWRREAPARIKDLPIFLLVERIGGRHWAAIRPSRGRDVRIISVRRARRGEVERHESP